MRQLPRAIHASSKTGCAAGFNVYGVCVPFSAWAEIIAKAFLKAGLVTEDDIVQQRLRAGVGNRIKPKLHATVMNSKLANTCVTPSLSLHAVPQRAWSRTSNTLLHARRSHRSHRPNACVCVRNACLNSGRGRREPFDASSIIRAYQERPLGSSPLKELHLSRRGAFGRNGFYKAGHVVPLPV